MSDLSKVEVIRPDRIFGPGRREAILRGAVLMAVITWLVLFLAPLTAFGAETDLEQSETTLFELSPLAVSSLLGVIIPIVVGVITKSSASPGLKAVANIVLSGVAAVVTQNLVEGGGAVLSQDTLVLAALTWVVSIATYFGLYKPAGVTDKVQTKTAGFGLGKAA